MVQLNPVPVFGAKKNTGTIWRKSFTEIAVQIVSAHKIIFISVGSHVASLWNRGLTKATRKWPILS